MARLVVWLPHLITWTYKEHEHLWEQLPTTSANWGAGSCYRGGGLASHLSEENSTEYVSVIIIQPTYIHTSVLIVLLCRESYSLIGLQQRGRAWRQNVNYFFYFFKLASVYCKENPSRLLQLEHKGLMRIYYKIDKTIINIITQNQWTRKDHNNPECQTLETIAKRRSLTLKHVCIKCDTLGRPQGSIHIWKTYVQTIWQGTNII